MPKIANRTLLSRAVSFCTRNKSIRPLQTRICLVACRAPRHRHCTAHALFRSVARWWLRLLPPYPKVEPFNNESPVRKDAENALAHPRDDSLLRQHQIVSWRIVLGCYVTL